MENKNKNYMGSIIFIILVIALGSFWIYSSKSKPVDNVPPPIVEQKPADNPVVATTTTVKNETQEYLPQYSAELKWLTDNFVPSKNIKKYYDGSWNMSFEYPDNFSVEKTSEVIIVVPPKIFELSTHLQTEFYLPAITLSFEKNVKKEDLITRESMGSLSTENIHRKYQTTTQIQMVDDFSGSVFYKEIYQAPGGVLVASYLKSSFSGNFSTVLDSIKVQ
jgi:hypothetical protein